MKYDTTHDPGVPAWKSALLRIQAQSEACELTPINETFPYSVRTAMRNSNRINVFNPSMGTLPQDWENRSYAVLDFETTGLDDRTDRVIEIGLIKFILDDHGLIREQGSLSVLIHPGMPIPARSTAVHGIYDLDVANAPAFAEIVAQLDNLIMDSTIIAHNASFDIGFLRSEYERAGVPLSVQSILDTIVLAKKALPGMKSYSLGALSRMLGIGTGNSHRALDDARACMYLFHHCAGLLSE